MQPRTASAASAGEDVRTWRPSWTAFATAVAIAVLVAGFSQVADRVPPAVEHALSHIAVGLPVGLLFLAAVRRWPAADAARPGRSGRWLVLAGLAGVAVGQLLEVAGARVDEAGALVTEEIAHTAGQIVTMLSMPVLLLGTLASLVAGLRTGRVPWRVAVLVGAAAAAGLGFLIVGAPGGG